MKLINNLSLTAVVFCCLLAACTREKDDVEELLSIEKYPQVILFDDEEGGELESSDELEVAIKLADRFDGTGGELGGVIEPLTQDFLLAFAISDIEGFDDIGDYVLEVEALYEIDDCTTSADEGVELIKSFDPATGKGTVLFPAGVEEIELVFTLSDELLDNEEVDDSRGFVIELSAVDGPDPDNVEVLSLPFEFKVLDDELIFGDWELDLEEPGAFENFKALFGMANEDLAELSLDDVDEIAWEFELAEVNIETVLKEEEEVEECGEVEIENIVVEVEGEFEELTDDDTEGEIEFVVEVELDDESVLEFVYKGTFVIQGKMLRMTLQGESDEGETEEITLVFRK
jgi:hypothetical protein